MGALVAACSDLANPERKRQGEREGKCEREIGKGQVNVVALLRGLAI